METGIHIGTQISKESLEPLTDSLIRIMESRADQETIRTALQVFAQKAEVRSVSLSNMNITMNSDATGVVVETPPTDFDD